MSLKDANIAAEQVLAGFDRMLADAEPMLKERPFVSSPSDAQIKRIAEAHFASILCDDDEEGVRGHDMSLCFQVLRNS